jgi:RHS repeat-associated protein
VITQHRKIFYVVFFLLLARTAPEILAQGYTVDIKPVRGFMPTADQVSSPIDSIEPVSGKMNTAIPLASVPRGRAGSGFDVALQYDSHLYDITPVVRDFTIDQYGHTEPGTALLLESALSTGGWTYNFANFRLDLETRLYDPYYCPNGSSLRVYRLRVGLPDGSQHVLQLRDGGDSFSGDSYDGNDDGFFGIAPNGLGPETFALPDGHSLGHSCWTNQGWYRNGRLTYYTSDGSFLKLEIEADGSPWQNKTWYLYFPDGRIAEGRWHQIEKLRDANGNTIIFANTLSSGVPTLTKIFHEEDGPDSERAVIISYNTQSTGTTKTDTVSGLGPNGRVTWTINWERIDIGGDGRKYISSDVSSIYPEWELNDYLGASLWVVHDVQLPMESATAFPNIWNSYEFQYSGNAECGYGELKSMRTPSNATYTYNYLLENTSNCQTERGTAAAIANLNNVTKRQVTGPGIQPLTTIYALDRNNAKTEITAPDMSKTVFWYGPADNLVYRIDEPNGSIRKRVWAQNKVYDVLALSNHDSNNPYIQKETVTVGNSSGAPAKTSVTEYTVDKNGNSLQKTQYDWVNYAGTYQGSTSGIENGSIVGRITSSSYWTPAPASVDTITNDWREYWYPHTYSGAPELPRRLNAVRRVDVGVPGSNYSANEFVYDNPYTTGNLITEYRWNNFSDLSTTAPGLGALTASNSQVLTRHYGPFGNLTQIDEPEIPTRITYDSVGHFPIQVEYAYTSGAHRTSNYSWYTDGSLRTKTDADNGFATTFTYDDAGRQRAAVDSASGNSLRKTRTTYDDANRKVTTMRDLSSFSDGKLQAVTHFDELGRVILTQASDGSPLVSDTDGIKVKTIYDTFSYGFDPGGRRIVTSTPYRTTSDGTLEWSCTQLDTLGRITDVGKFSGGLAPSDCTSNSSRTGLTHTSYNADKVTVTDPASKVHRETRDGLGRLTAVIEDPGGLNFSTAYAYDPLDRMTSVSQGPQIRTFRYSSLGLLKDAANPESGTISYTYTAGGDPATRTDARGITTTYSYDGLHRVLTKSYSGDGGFTPNVSYQYYGADAPLGSIGQLQSVTSSAATVTYGSYDALGRVQSSTQAIGGSTYTFQYSFRLNDGLSSIQYPSGKIVDYAVDDAGRVNKVSTAGRIYADLPAGIESFTADGRIAQMKLGNDLWETHVYQTPGAPTLLKLGTSAGSNDKLELEFDYSGTANNGNLSNQVMRQAGHTWTQSYSYDAVNRLMAANEAGGFSRTYGYDRYGNRWVASSSGITAWDPHEPTAGSLFDISTNRLANQSYDAAGNQTSYDPRTMAYDAENRMIRATSANNGSESYIYDGDGRRVKKNWSPNGGSPQVTTYVYDANGQLAVEYTNQIAAATGTSWMFTDILGSVRAVTGEKPQSGTAPMTECYDYLPFGRMLSSSDNGRNTGCFPASPDFTLASIESQKFTGKVRDVETGLDFFGARYLSGAEGRFQSVDPSQKSVNPSNPQSWNRYTYANNNPLSYVDDNGKWPSPIHHGLLAGAFGRLSPEQQGLLNTGSDFVDYSLFGQMLPSRAYQHGERGPNESPEEARRTTDAFIGEHESSAQRWSDRLKTVDGWALVEFGTAMHPVMDRTSPPHSNEQIFEGIPSKLSNLGSTVGIFFELSKIVAHNNKESQISRETYRKTVDEIRTNFLKTFGQSNFENATGCKQVDGCAYDYSVLPEKYWKD